MSDLADKALRLYRENQKKIEAGKKRKTKERRKSATAYAAGVLEVDSARLNLAMDYDNPSDLVWYFRHEGFDFCVTYGGHRVWNLQVVATLGGMKSIESLRALGRYIHDRTVQPYA